MTSTDPTSGIPWPVHPAADRLRLLADDELQLLAADIAEHGLHEPVWLYDDPARGVVLLDGRNRARACALVGVDVTEHVRWYSGTRPWAFVLSEGCRRRQLTAGEAVAYVVGAKDELQAEREADDLRRQAEEDARQRMAEAGRRAQEQKAEASRAAAADDTAVDHQGCESMRTLGDQQDEPKPKKKKPKKKRRAADDIAEIAGVSGRSVEQFLRVQDQAPDLAAQVNSGELSIAAAERKLKDRIAAERRRERAEETVAAAKGRYDLRGGDFRDVLADIPDNSVDLILTDPPYGDDATPIYGELAKFASRVLVDGGSLICYSGQSVLPDVFDQLTPHLRYWWTLSLDHAHGGQQLPGKWVMVEWKPILWFVKGHRRGREYLADRVRGSRPDKDAHEWAQGITETFYMIEQLTEPGQLVVDPFAGSGSFGLAAIELGRNFIGADLNPGSRTGQVVA